MKIIGIHKVRASAPCYLIEAEIDPPGLHYDWGEVTQEAAGQPRDNWQAPWDERKLDDEGKRWAFFFHFLDLKKPLLTPDRPAALPNETDMPDHLRAINYQEVD